MTDTRTRDPESAGGNNSRLRGGLRGRLRLVSVPAGVVLALLVSGCDNDSPGAAEAAGTPPASTPLEEASVECKAGFVADGGQTLIVDTKGDDDTSGDSVAELACLLFHLDTPTSVTEHMSSTRALDGMQTNTWDQFSARWTYHPDNGMALTITLSD